MDVDKDVFEKIKWNYNQLTNIVRNESEDSTRINKRIGNLEKIIKIQLPETLNKVAPPNIYDLQNDFFAEYEKFKDFMIYETLIGKNVIGLGGGFSSGKSSFLNSLMGYGEILPVNINPSTSVPTYIVKGDGKNVKAINIFDTVTNLDLFAINQIAHGFGDVGNNMETEKVQLGHILKNLFLETSSHKYDNIAFLDTPGYSKPESEMYSKKTDENIARAQLNTVDYILWFLPVNEAGSFTTSDIKFIKSLHKEIPITVICSKANRRTEEQRQEIFNKIKEQVVFENLNVENVYFFDTENDNGLDRKNIDNLFSELNKGNCNKDEFAKRFKKLFLECKEYYKKQKEQATIEIRNLSNALLKLEEGDDASIYIERVKASSVKERKVMEEAEKNISRIQNEFFKEIKLVADEVGIYMPEPKDIDVLEDKINNPLIVLQKYNKHKNIKVKTELGNIINDALINIEPVFEYKPGGSLHKNVLIDTLKEIDFPKKEEIFFGNDINYKQLMSEALSDIKNNNEIFFGNDINYKQLMSEALCDVKNNNAKLK